MSFEIIGTCDANRIYCAGSFTKLLTTYVSLSFLSESHLLEMILDDAALFNRLAKNETSLRFLRLFQTHLGGDFTLHDICSYYAGLPYTFDPSGDELHRADEGYPFKHHSIPDEKTFLFMCENHITPVYPVRSKFHYSEISILFLGYFLEKCFNVRMEDLFQQYIIKPFKLASSHFSRKRVEGVFIQDLSDRYDYPSIAILDHGYFCYSNGFYTTLNDMKNMLEQLIHEPVFHFMTDLTHARAASNRLMNGLAVEIRLVGDDVISGYEGLSFSGCNLWAYSSKMQRGYLTFNNSEEEIYTIIYDQVLGYTQFDTVLTSSQSCYQHFLAAYHEVNQQKNIPAEFQGIYQRVNINESTLHDKFIVGNDFIVIRNPDEVRYEIICVNNEYRIIGKDHIHGARFGFYQTLMNHRYMCFDGTLYVQS